MENSEEKLDNLPLNAGEKIELIEKMKETKTKEIEKSNNMGFKNRGKFELDDKDDNSNSLIYDKLSFLFLYYKRIGLCFQDNLLNCSNKMNVSSNHFILFTFFFILSLFLLLWALFYFPVFIVKPEIFLLIISSGNISLTISYLFYYGSDTFFELLADKNKTELIFTYIIFNFFGFFLGFISIIINFYLLDIIFDLLIGNISFDFFLYFLPKKEKLIDIIEKIKTLFSDIKEVISIKSDEDKNNINFKHNEKLSKKIKSFIFQ